MTNWMVLALPAALLLALPSAAAAQLDGSKVMVCGWTESFDCDADMNCTSGEASDIDVPELIRIDVTKKTITSLTTDRRGEETQIERVKTVGNRLILQGVEGARGWSLVVDSDDGSAALSAAGDEVAFVVFGECSLP